MKQLRLTKAQKECLVSATPERENCAYPDVRVADNLVNLGLAKFTTGFGWRFGRLIELTPEGILLRDELNKNKKVSNE